MRWLYPGRRGGVKESGGGGLGGGGLILMRSVAMETARLYCPACRRMVSHEWQGQTAGKHGYQCGECGRVHWRGIKA